VFEKDWWVLLVQVMGIKKKAMQPIVMLFKSVGYKQNVIADGRK